MKIGLLPAILLVLGFAGTASAQESATLEVNVTVEPAAELAKMTVERNFDLSLSAPRGSNQSHHCLYAILANSQILRSVDAGLNNISGVKGCGIQKATLAQVLIECPAGLLMNFTADMVPAVNGGGRLLLPDEWDYAYLSISRPDATGASMYNASANEPELSLTCSDSGKLTAYLGAALLVPTQGQTGDFVMGTITLATNY